MTDLLAIEWLKLKRYRTFWVLIVLFALLLPLWNYEISTGAIAIGGAGKSGINVFSTQYSFPNVWGNLGWWGSIFITFISILVIIVTTNEYGYRTNRQNVIDGWQRLQFYHAKVFLIIALSALLTLFLFLLGLIFGRANSGSFYGCFSGLAQVGYFFVLTLDYLGFALLIAILIKKSGLAIGLFLLYSLIIENILKALINQYSGTNPVGNLLPLQASDELLPFPLTRMALAMVHITPSISMPAYCWVAIGWCIVYYLAGRTILLKSDW
jgi:ABC-2 type transport system permease protein